MSNYPNGLIYFMWEYQVHFRLACQTKSESLFNHFDRGLLPNVIILGIQNTPDGKLPKICFEHEKFDFLEPSFIELEDKSNKLLEEHPRRNMFYSGPGVQNEMDQKLIAECKRLAISQILSTQEEIKQDVFFVSKAVNINNYSVYVVLSLNKIIYDSHTHLKNGYYKDFKIPKSILEASVSSFLEDCECNLYLPNPGKNLKSDRRTYDELLREAARTFMNTISIKGNAFEGFHGLFDACNNISTYKYEGKENIGQLIIADKKHSDIQLTLELNEPFYLRDFRKSRKMLQLSNQDIGVVCNTYEVLGLGAISSEYDQNEETIFTIKFKGIHCWEVWHQNQPLLFMKFGLPHLANEVVNKVTFFSDCKRLFNGIEETRIQNLYNLTVAATKQKNGALLVITTDAEGEANRLSKQSIPIKPIRLDEHVLLNLTAIDGGILLNPEGVAFAQGVILDGIVADKGDSARGSRYNSAITYYDFKGKITPTLIVVVSEDGMVDIIPYLRPQVSRQEIINILAILEDLKKNFDRGTYNQIMYWLTNRKFYLSQDQCDYINNVRKEIDSKPFDGLRIIHNDLFPNPEMDDSYFNDY